MTTLPVEMINRSGHTLRGIVTLPSNMTQAPIVLHLHGFTGSKSGYRSAFVHLARTLAENGYGCARFDFYGNCESDGEFEDMTFTSLLEDTEDLAAWIRAQSWAAPDRLILSGQSMGGFVAASAAPRVQPYALVLQCPGAGMWEGCKERADELTSHGTNFADIEGLRFSVAFNYDLAQYSPWEDATGYFGKVLLVRGTADKLVDEATCKRYCDIYGTQASYVSIAAADHNFASISARTACEQAVIGFLSNID